ncbi:PepSY domain-containing protein [Castellaniella defragrans]|uniref:PepSY domain-containing protein n=1 Tax=Castellaniella defragrans TaxID=75697 RepID=UPI0023F3438F|nr:PepSY domain-containing protein [Castellaniella defragrans]
MKKSWNTFGVCLLAVSLAGIVAPALADDDCDVPVERWQTRDAVSQMARQKGWDLKRIKIDDGCYEVRGQDAGGRAFKAKLDPETLEIVEIRYRDHKDRERRRDHDRGELRDTAPAASTPAASTPAAPAAAPEGKPSAGISVGGARIE